MKKEELVKEAIKGREYSYSPYSKFKVGAAVLTKDNKIYYGANIENSSFGLTNCAERNAVFNAYCHGEKKENLVAIAIVADCDRPVSPCGACRQVLSELLPSNAKIYLSNLKLEIKETSVEELLPYSFSGDDIK